MTPAVRTLRMIPGYELKHAWVWTSSAGIISLEEASLRVYDVHTGDELVDWTVASGHFVVAGNRAQLVVPEAETITYAGQLLRYLLGLQAAGGGLSPVIEGPLLTR